MIICTTECPHVYIVLKKTALGIFISLSEFTFHFGTVFSKIISFSIQVRKCLLGETVVDLYILFTFTKTRFLYFNGRS